MKNKTVWIVGGIVVFIILIVIISSSDSSNNSPAQLASDNQPSLCSDIASLKNQAMAVDFKELNKDPGSFNGKIAKFTGQVLQIQESNGYGIARLAVTKESYGWSSSDVVYVEYQGHTDAVDDDVVTAYGQLTGSKTYESQAHFQITIPSMTACVIEKGTGDTVTQNNPAPKATTPKPTSANQSLSQQATQPSTPSAPALSVSCSVSQTSLTAGQTAVWTAQVSGGTGSYSFSWSGSESLSGNTQSVTKSYSSAGTKNAQVNVVSGSQSVNQSCSNSVSVIKPAPAPITISGNGQQASQRFNLDQGLSIFTMQNTGQSNFIVHLLDSNGNTVDGLANEIGNFSGSKAEHISNAGSYLFDVDSDGPWTITITQPRPTSAQSPSSLNGRGPQATSFFSLPQGLHTFAFTHDGSSNFIVHLLDVNGNTVEGLVNVIGSYNGSKAVRIDDSGIYLLNIDADGNWTASIQ
jgi:hypothetical protein